jgi:hypothetical protein
MALPRARRPRLLLIPSFSRSPLVLVYFVAGAGQVRYLKQHVNKIIVFLTLSTCCGVKIAIVEYCLLQFANLGR